MPSIGGHKIGARNLLGVETDTRKMLWMLDASNFERNWEILASLGFQISLVHASVHRYTGTVRKGDTKRYGSLTEPWGVISRCITPLNIRKKWAAPWSHPASSILNRNRPNRRTSPFSGQTSWPIILYRGNMGDHLAFQLYRALVFPVSLFLVQCNARQVGTSSSFKVHMHIWSLSCAWRFHDVGHSLRPVLKFDTRMTSHKLYERARG